MEVWRNYPLSSLWSYWEEEETERKRPLYPSLPERGESIGDGRPKRKRGKRENDFFTIFIPRVEGEKEANLSFSQSSTFVFWIQVKVSSGCLFPVIGYLKRKARERGRDLSTLFFAERIKNEKGKLSFYHSTSLVIYLSMKSLVIQREPRKRGRDFFTLIF